MGGEGRGRGGGEGRGRKRGEGRRGVPSRGEGRRGEGGRRGGVCVEKTHHVFHILSPQQPAEENIKHGCQVTISRKVEGKWESLKA